MEKLKKTFLILKELWAIKSIRAIMILIGYFIFFTFVIAIIRTSYHDNLEMRKERSVSAIDKFAVKKDYKAIITNGENVYEFLNKNNMEYIIINDVYYKIESDILTPIDYKTDSKIDATVPAFPVKFWKFNCENIVKLIKKGTLEYKTEFTNKDLKKGYVVPVKEVLLEIDNITNNDENSNIKIELLERDKNIIEVNMDITNYYNVITGTSFDFKFKIEY